MVKRTIIRAAMRWHGRMTPSTNAWAIGDQALVSGANFLTAALLIRRLGADEFGVFALAWTLLLLANSVQNALVLSPMLTLSPKLAAQGAAPYFGALVVHQLGCATLSALPDPGCRLSR